jgi:hypothetical protein
MMNAMEIRAQQWDAFWRTWILPQREAAEINAELLAAEQERERRLDHAKLLRDQIQREIDRERRRALKKLAGRSRL